VKKKLPSMYHQFKELADVDITKAPWKSGPTCHYMMGGIRVDAETAQSTIPGLFAAAKRPLVFTVRIASAEIRSPISWSSAVAPDLRPLNTPSALPLLPSTTRKSSKPKKNCLLLSPTPARKVLMLSIVTCRK